MRRMPGSTGFAWETDRYAQQFWHEYTAAAERVKEMQAEHKAAIAKELYVALERLEAPPDLLSIIGATANRCAW
jgi:hypothetical protein